VEEDLPKLKKNPFPKFWRDLHFKRKHFQKPLVQNRGKRKKDREDTSLIG